ncbi:MAG: hypothetical protein A2622_12990 [Bdellovibrionales bacterium RIFCSPHIGHO2_01_FULL_40_29]|nr:MAG: hypothetical protein A2622_12990 [Bdellovibrionales bacterium RIFCSPHIGHO2_01_FULL_40_29]OFZ33391.1 MAG: hypothetical protein A3D17_13895 [Bdellovibrionales bacterium RIFCSPHIGHO2_02_FULL_40_15]
MKRTQFILLFIFTIPTLSWGRTFKNAYISFEMLDNWKCQLEQTEWVCRAEGPQESKEAVIILTAKEKGPTDTFALYQNHMNNPITTTNRAGQRLTSGVVYKSVQTRINDQPWLDALHTNSEVQNYYTRYLATIKDQIAILVTFSAHNKYYSKHSTNFNNTVKSLRVIASKDLLSRPDLGPLRGSGETLGSGIGQAMPADLLATEETSGKSRKGFLKNPIFMGLSILILALIGYVVMQMKKKK